MYAFATSTPIAVRPAAGVATCAPVRHEIRAAKHVQKKATKKHIDRRPKKKRPSDKNRTPPAYDVDPLHAEGLPSEYTVLGEVDEMPEVIPLSELEGVQLIVPEDNSSTTLAA